jgi:hypothetical protein
LCSKLLTKTAAERFTPTDALNHPWFQEQLEVEGNVNEPEEEQEEQKDRFADLKNMQNIVEGQKTTLQSATPVMAGRKIKGAPPETPFMSKGLKP